MMKQILSLILLLFSFNAIAQYDSTKTLQDIQATGYTWKNAQVKYSQLIPRDTTKLALKDSGAIAYKGGKLWLYNGRYWVMSSADPARFGVEDNTATQDRFMDLNNQSFAIFNGELDYYDLPQFRISADIPGGSGGIAQIIANAKKVDKPVPFVSLLADDVGKRVTMDITNTRATIKKDAGAEKEIVTSVNNVLADSLGNVSVNTKDSSAYHTIAQSVDSSYFLIKNLSGGSDTVFVDLSSVGMSQWVTVGSNIHYPTGNVGINNTIPAEKLDIGGSLNISAGSSYKYGGLPIIRALPNNKNYFIGNSAGNLTMSGLGMTAVGDSALLANTTASNNSAFGRQSLRKNTTGFANTAIGSFTLSNNLTTSNNTAVGYSSLYNNTAIDNVSIGSNSMFFNTSGYGNTALGTTSMQNNVNGYYNTATGQSSLFTNSSGYENVANGYWAMIFNTTGSENVAMGVTAMRQNKTGSQNVAIGREALRNDTSGSTNTGLGYQVGYSNFNGSGNVLLGYKAGFFESGSNKLYVSNSNTLTPLLYGDFSSPSLVINGGAAANVASSILTVTSNTKGALLPKMTKTERNAIASPAQGLLVFVTDNGGYLSWYNGGWQKISSITD